MHFFNIAFMALLAQCLASCEPNKVLGKGFKAEFFRYPLNEKSGWDKNFPRAGYKQFGYLGQMDNVKKTEFSVSSTAAANEVVSGRIYDFPITTSNFSIKLSGYFKATQTGKHQFAIGSDEGAYLNVLPGIMCDGNQSANKTKGLSIGPSKPQKDAEIPSRGIASIFLKKGVYYPLQLFLFNSQQSTSLRTLVILPDGSKVSDIGEVVLRVKFHKSKISKRGYAKDNYKCRVYKVPADYQEDGTSYGSSSNKNTGSKYDKASKGNADDDENDSKGSSYGSSSNKNTGSKYGKDDEYHIHEDEDDEYHIHEDEDDEYHIHEDEDDEYHIHEDEDDEYHVHEDDDDEYHIHEDEDDEYHVHEDEDDEYHVHEDEDDEYHIHEDEDDEYHVHEDDDDEYHIHEDEDYDTDNGRFSNSCLVGLYKSHVPSDKWMDGANMYIPCYDENGVHYDDKYF